VLMFARKCCLSGVVDAEARMSCSTQNGAERSRTEVAKKFMQLSTILISALVPGGHMYGLDTGGDGTDIYAAWLLQREQRVVLTAVVLKADAGSVRVSGANPCWESPLGRVMRGQV
jgi:hypothetical protein